MNPATMSERVGYRLGAAAFIWGIVAMLGCACACGQKPGRTSDAGGNLQSKETKPSAPLTFEGSTEKLTGTVILPTLDTPMPEGKSAIWCSSFQLAWNRLKADITNGPVLLRRNNAVADRLNRAEATAADLTKGSWYAAAGRVDQGIIDRIQREMAAQFPDAPKPSLAEARSGGVVAYAFLRAQVKYDFELQDNPSPLPFKDSAGKVTNVQSFGILKSDENFGLRTFRGQIDLLFHDSGEFALDLCRESQPNQLVVARVARKQTLAETLSALQKKTARKVPQNFAQTSLKATLLIPNMAWRLEHHFKELEGDVSLNPELQGLTLAAAVQTTAFQLDRRGALLESDAKTVFLNGDDAHEFHFDRPFLIILKKRKAKHPFFVMWVDNAELLGKK